QAAALHVREQLFAGVDQVGNLPGNTVTGGRINANNSMQLIMAACSACPPPLNLAVQASGADAADLSWTAGTGGPFVVRYRAVGAAQWTVVTGIDALSYTATGIDLCVPHEFQVNVLCGEEESGFSGSVLLEPPVETAPVIAVDGLRTICHGEEVVLTSSQATDVQWSTGATTATISVGQSGSYTVTFNGLCGTFTSEAVEVLVVGDVPPMAEDVVLEAPGPAVLTATGDSVLWYASAVSDAPVAWGSPWETPPIEAPTSFWASNMVTVEPAEVFGGPENRLMPGAYHTNGSFWLEFQADEPFTIRSVKVFANGAGDRTIGLVNSVGTVVAQGTFTIPNGESRVDLEFDVPAAGQYGLRIMAGNPQLWRDGLGSNPEFPYSLGTYGAITGTTATGANATAYYYFFYDWEVQGPAITCETDRTEVAISIATGVDEQQAADGVRMFPNPADRVIFIDVQVPMGGVQARVVVQDPAGRVVAEKATAQGRATITTAFLADGMYVYRVLHQGAVIGSGKFIVSHL
ncbi:MAG: T9SS type A sorting domain-containing protein, partial [Flavobacteriales bacterium]|nr:T9SS type A sorting domain-containing protein [Flavobacteriales bacterium]